MSHTRQGPGFRCSWRGGAVIALVALLSGCNKHVRLVGVRGTPDPSDVVFIGAGQSNMSFEHLGETFPHSFNVASPGTSMAQWQPGQPLYQNMVATIKAQTKPCVLLFWQGEAEGLGFDVNNAPVTDWATWDQGFVYMAQSLRRDVGYSIPIIMVQIGQRDSTAYPSPHWIDVQQEQAAVRLPGMVMVSAADMFPAGDNLVHYSDAQYKTMQQRMLNVWENGE